MAGEDVHFLRGFVRSLDAVNVHFFASFAFPSGSFRFAKGSARNLAKKNFQ